MPDHVNIPDERIGVLIGEDGATKRRIEERCEVAIEVDSESGAVAIDRDGDPLKGLKGPQVVKAIARGFPPESALKLLQEVESPGESMVYDSIDVKDATGSPSEFESKKGRLIGKDGRTRELMEELTGADVRIYGSTVGAIGTTTQVRIAMEACEMILEGAPHGTVYSYMEEQRSQFRGREIAYYESGEEPI